MADDDKEGTEESSKKRRGKPGKPPAPKRAKKAKQTQIPGTERNERIPEIEAAAVAYVEVRDERMALTKQEVAKREVLRAAMKNAGQTVYECDGEDLTVTLVPAKDEKIKVTRRDAEADDDDIEIED